MIEMPGCTKALEHVHFVEDATKTQVIADQVKILARSLSCLLVAAIVNFSRSI